MDRAFDQASVITVRFLPQLGTVSDFIKESAWEIRLYSGRPVVLRGAFGWRFVSKKGGETFDRQEALILTDEQLFKIFSALCDYSVYSYEKELRQGFLTQNGGHRVGIGACAVLQDEKLMTLRQISSLCIRIAREQKGCAEELFRKVPWQGGILLAGAPCTGKTTILRDMARLLGNRMIPVSLVDERSEISGGRGTNIDVGICTDVLLGYPKKEGILTALRALSPAAILCDEVGSREDSAAIRQGVCAGVSMIATIHADNARELLKRSQAKLLLETGAFQSVAFLDGKQKGKLKAVVSLEELKNYEMDWNGFNCNSLPGIWCDERMGACTTGAAN